MRGGENGAAAREHLHAEARNRVYAVLLRKGAMVLAAGHSVIVDAVFAEPEERRGIEAVAAETRRPFHGSVAAAPPDQLTERVAARRDDASDATPEVVRRS